MARGRQQLAVAVGDMKQVGTVESQLQRPAGAHVPAAEEERSGQTGEMKSTLLGCGG